MGGLPSVAIFIEGALVDTFLPHVLHQLLVPDFLAEVPQVAGDDLQVVPGVPGQAGLGRVDSVESALEKSNQIFSVAPFESDIFSTSVNRDSHLDVKGVWSLV